MPEEERGRWERIFWGLTLGPPFSCLGSRLLLPLFSCSFPVFLFAPSFLQKNASSRQSFPFSKLSVNLKLSKRKTSLPCHPSLPLPLSPKECAGSYSAPLCPQECSGGQRVACAAPSSQRQVWGSQRTHAGIEVSVSRNGTGTHPSAAWKQGERAETERSQSFKA